MSAVSRVPVLVSTLSFGAVVGVLASTPSLRKRLPFISAMIPSSTFRLLLLIFAFLNLKNLPFVWHWRVLKGIIYQLKISKQTLTRRDLFKPLITTSWNSILDCDYNLHKSNSTYFADLDVARAHFVGCLLRTSLERLNRGDYEGLPKDKIEEARGSGAMDYIIALGGVGCVFRKEIKPFQKFEIWTRLLSWDQKWIYIVSHIVKPGAKRPERYTMQPWRRHKKGRKATSTAQRDKEEQDFTKSIFASSISKYVCKKGRMTVPPETLFERSHLLPPRPESATASSPSPPETQSGVLIPLASEPISETDSPANLSSPESIGVTATAVTAQLEASQRLHTNTHGRGSAGARQEEENEDMLTWDEVEEERKRGLKIASQFEGLTALHAEFGRSDVAGGDGEALGRFGDWLW